MSIRTIIGRILTLLLATVACSLPPARAAEDLNVLFLGDNGHHRPRERFEQLQPVLAARGVKLTYTDNMQDLNSQKLGAYDALLLYANIDRIEPAQEKALLDYVSQGGGFVPLHCATYCFRNSAEIVALMGAQFQRHGTGVFRTQLADTPHPLMKGFGGFESWDETYVHHLHNEKDRTVLSYRVDAEGREPWTWVRTRGMGRVFYTAWGHDQRTWGNPGFQNLVERGIRWAAGQDPAVVPAYLAEQAFPVPELNPPGKDVKPFEYVDVGAKIPNYVPSNRWGTQAKPLNMMQRPLPAEESMKHLVVPRGFRVELFAAEPDLGGKPIAMSWDERGRLWVCETYDYPNELQPPGEGRDRIRICEDRDGDGKADKFTVFAEKLSIPASIAFWKNGVIVQDAARTLYLRDTDGDDRADEQSVLFTGWAVGDTHGGVSNFQYGLDNWIWAMQGYNQSTPVANGKPQQSFRQGFFRFRPDGSEVEFIRSTDNNTWGLGISEEGLIFGSTANRNPSVYMPIPNRYYERVRGWTPSLTLRGIADTYLFKPITDKVRQVDQHGGYTAGAGHALYTGRAYPQQYWNSTAFVNGPTGHLVGTFVLKGKGSDFASRSPFNLLASDDEWTAPIMTEVGPDGNLWVLDWYNFIVQHNPTPRGFSSGRGNAYETDLRDKKHGRVYRVIHEAAKAEQPRTLQNAAPEEMVAALTWPTMLWRKHAQRLLVERGKSDVLPQLQELVGDPRLDEIGLNVGAIHALWTMHGLGALDGSNAEANKVALAALRHGSAGVRRNACQVLPPTPESTRAILSAHLLQDPNAQVRLAAFLALSDLPAVDDSGRAVAQALLQPENRSDRWIPDAATSAAAHNPIDYLKAFSPNSDPPAELVQIATVVAEHQGRDGSADSVGPLIEALVDVHPAIANAAVAGLARGWNSSSKPVLTAETEANLERLLTRLDAGNRGLLLRLATRWGSGKFEKFAKQVVDDLLAQVDNQALSTPQRLAAARQLVEFRQDDANHVRLILDRVTPQSPPELAEGLIQALQASEAAEMGNLLVEQFPSLTPASRAVGVVVLLSRKSSAKALLDGAKRGRLQLSELSLDQKQALAAHPDREIRELARGMLESGGALPNPDRQKVLESLIAITKETGDAKAGKEVFKKQCAKCHLHSGEGTRIGPDLTGMAVHPKEELLTHIIDPSRSVEGNFRVYTLVTARGQVLNGMLASESKTAIELFDAEGKKKTILRDDVEELLASTKSLMPAGFEKQVTRRAITDLLEFLTQRGKYLPIDLSKVATITSVRGMFNDPQAGVERLIFSDWAPKVFKGVPFQLVDPLDGRKPNAILLYGPNGAVCSKMPRGVQLPCNGPAKAIHLLSGVSGWGFPFGQKGSVTMIVRLHYRDGEIEEIPLLNGVHFADYIRRQDVEGSEFAYQLRGQQLRYLAIHPKRQEPIDHIEFAKGDDRASPIVMSVTLESL